MILQQNFASLWTIIKKKNQCSESSIRIPTLWLRGYSLVWQMINPFLSHNQKKTIPLFPTHTKQKKTEFPNINMPMGADRRNKTSIYTYVVRVKTKCWIENNSNSLHLRNIMRQNISDSSFSFSHFTVAPQRPPPDGLSCRGVASDASCPNHLDTSFIHHSPLLLLLCSHILPEATNGAAADVGPVVVS